VKNKIRVSLVIEMSDDELSEFARKNRRSVAETEKDIAAYVYVSVQRLPALTGIIVRLEDA
jgi:hypothetical protein